MKPDDTNPSRIRGYLCKFDDHDLGVTFILQVLGLIDRSESFRIPFSYLRLD